MPRSMGYSKPKYLHNTNLCCIYAILVLWRNSSTLEQDKAAILKSHGTTGRGTWNQHDLEGFMQGLLEK